MTIKIDATRYCNLRLDDRGRVTIPKDVREELAATEGDRIELAIIARNPPADE